MFKRKNSRLFTFWVMISFLQFSCSVPSDEESEEPNETTTSEIQVETLNIGSSELPAITDPVIALDENLASNENSEVSQKVQETHNFNSLQIASLNQWDIVATKGISMAKTAKEHKLAFQSASPASSMACEMTVQAHLRLFEASLADSMQCFISSLVAQESQYLDGKDHIINLKLFDDESQKNIDVPAKIRLQSEMDQLSGFQFWACKDGKQAYYTEINFKDNLVDMTSVLRRLEPTLNISTLIGIHCENGEAFDSDGDGIDDSCSGGIKCNQGVASDSNGDGVNDSCSANEKTDETNSEDEGLLTWIHMHLTSLIDTNKKLVGLKEVDITTFKESTVPIEWGKIKIKQSDQYIQIEGWNHNTNGNSIDKDFDEFSFFSELLDSSSSLKDFALKKLSLGDGAGQLKQKRNENTTDYTQGWLADTLTIESEDINVQKMKGKVKTLPTSNESAHKVSFSGVQAWDCSGTPEKIFTISAELAKSCDDRYMIDQNVSQLDCSSLK